MSRPQFHWHPEGNFQEQIKSEGVTRSEQGTYVVKYKVEVTVGKVVSAPTTDTPVVTTVAVVVCRMYEEQKLEAADSILGARRASKTSSTRHAVRASYVS